MNEKLVFIKSLSAGTSMDWLDWWEVVLILKMHFLHFFINTFLNLVEFVATAD